MSLAQINHKVRNRIMTPVHLVVILLSILLITLITLDTLRDISFLANEIYLKVQFWCCVVFEIDILLEMIFSQDRWRYLRTHVLFILISIPYLNIIHYLNLYVAPEWQYLLRFVPMIRAAYVLSLIHI